MVRGEEGVSREGRFVQGWSLRVPCHPCPSWALLTLGTRRWKPQPHYPRSLSFSGTKAGSLGCRTCPGHGIWWCLSLPVNIGRAPWPLGTSGLEEELLCCSVWPMSSCLFSSSSSLLEFRYFCASCHLSHRTNCFLCGDLLVILSLSDLCSLLGSDGLGQVEQCWLKANWRPPNLFLCLSLPCCLLKHTWSLHAGQRVKGPCSLFSAKSSLLMSCFSFSLPQWLWRSANSCFSFFVFLHLTGI